MNELSAGEVMATSGIFVFSVTVTDALPILPAASVAVRVMVFAPSVRFSDNCVVWLIPSTVHATVTGL